MPAAFSAEKAAKSAGDKTELSFSILPKSLQANPDLEMTVITEMTQVGRDAPKSSATNPVYYEAQSVAFREEGEGSAGNKKIPEAELREMMQTSLLKNHYLPADSKAGHPPTLLLLYQWGIHARVFNDEYTSSEIRDMIEWATALEQLANGKSLADDIRDQLDHSPETRLRWLKTDATERKNLLERAALVGGNKFARELRQALERTDILRDQTYKKTESSAKETVTLLGAYSSLRLNDLIRPDLLLPENGNPLHEFLARNPKAEFLFGQAAYDVYFVVATAYDYAAVAKGERKILWRTKMTVNAQGVSMLESMPQLIAVSAPCFGREMSEAATLSRPLRGKADVNIGPLQVVEPETALPSKTKK